MIHDNSRLTLPNSCRRVAVWFLSIAPWAMAAAAPDSTAGPLPPDEPWAIHGQFTYVEQNTDSFRAPYAGPNSLSPDRGRETSDATLYLGVRLWAGAEGWVVPEIDEGFGLDDTLGVAGFTSGEAYKVGKNKPYLRLPRAFIRQTRDSSTEREGIDGAALQLGGWHSIDRWVFTVGKFSVTDIFDTNQYAHDPRADFLNWTAIDAGSFDYAADAWGFTIGAAAERYQGSWTFRAGVFDLSNVPNSPHLDPGAHEFQIDAEIERRYALGNAPGRAVVTMFDSRARMGLLDSAVQLAATTGNPVDIAAVRQYRGRWGISLDIEQQLVPDLGAFGRLGKAAGNVETYEFTDVDRSVSLGVSLKGTRWQRPDDDLGLAAIDNDISAERRRYLEAGGLGILVGDGKLPHAAAEQIVETYYSLNLIGRLFASLDYQWIKSPAYNSDRGPVSVVSVRLHAQF